MNKVSYVIVFVVVIFLAGCTSHLVPSIRSVDPAAVPDFKGDQAVCVVNISTATTETVLGRDSLNTETYMGNLSKWTDTAVALLKLELQKRGFSIRDGGDDTRVIKLAIRSAQITVPTRTKCFVELHLETGDGYSRNYIVNSSSLLEHRAVNAVVTKAIIAVLNDNNIIEYLQAADAEKGTP